MPSQIHRLGVDFRSAPLAVREQFAFTAPQAERFLGLASGCGLGELMILATCNRTEFFVSGVEAGAVLPRLVSVFRVWRPDLQPVYQDCARFQQQGEPAVRSLFRIASGLESQILGDTHIQTQVRQAIETARAAGTLGIDLQTAGECALRAAKRVRRQTGISAGSASIGAAVLRSIRKWNRGGLSILLAGAGQAGRDIAAHLAKSRGYQLGFAARRQQVCQEMASTYGGRAVAWDRLEDEAARADVIVSAISDRLALLEAAAVASIMERRNQPLLIVDAGVPRNADPAAGSLDGVTLLDIDTLEREQAGALAERERRLPAAEGILEQEMERWRRMVAWCEVEPSVKQLYLAAERLRLEALGCSGAGQDIDRITGRLVKRLLAGPVEQLRAAIFLAPGDQAAQAVNAWRQVAPLFLQRK